MRTGDPRTARQSAHPQRSAAMTTDAASRPKVTQYASKRAKGFGMTSIKEVKSKQAMVRTIRRHVPNAVLFLLCMVGTATKAASSTVYVSYVTRTGAQVRAEPSETGGVVYSPPQLGVLEVVDFESQANWLQVVTPSGSKGWILRSSVTFDKGGATDVSVAKKGAVDRDFAKAELLKWWQTTGKNATPVCDICNARVPPNTGYMLTSKQVLASRSYHDLLKRTRPSFERYKQTVAQFEQDRTPWCICEACIETHFVDVPGSSNPKELAVALEANDDLRRRTLQAVKAKYTIDQVREKMRAGIVWMVEDPQRKNSIIPITPKVDGWILESLEKEAKQKLPGSNTAQ